jgi:c-di-GMP-binding flagellar brake protein YcgR
MKLGRSSAKSRRPGKITLPERFDAVAVVRPSGERVQAQVAEREPDGLLVALLFRAETPLEAGLLEGLTLEFTNPHGRVRARGTVTLVERELLRFSALHSIEVIQQREYVRVLSTRPVLVITSSSQGTLQTYTVDLSGGGLLLAGPDTLRVGEQVRIRLTLAKGSPQLEGVGTVVRTDLQGHRALCFDEIAAGDHRRLVRFIFDCQRAERRRGLEQGGYGR